jgi:hypothetical protein
MSTTRRVTEKSDQPIEKTGEASMAEGYAGERVIAGISRGRDALGADQPFILFKKYNPG